MIKALVPITMFVVLFVLLMASLDRNTRLVPSPLIDKPAPTSALPVLESDTVFSPQKMLEKRWVMNVWASWCVACRQEHRALLELAKYTSVNLVGYNYKDTPEKATQWLANFGNPYTIIVQDREGEVALDWGVYGVPETYLIDELGIIRYKHIGPIDDTTIKTIILPFLNTGFIS